MTHPMQSQADEMRQMILDDLNKGQTKIFEGLVNNIQVKTISEKIFRDYFLPCFLGNPSSQHWVAEWIGIAGSPSAEVAVINEQGEELFLVPPMIASTSMALAQHQFGQARMNDIFAHTSNVANNSPHQAMVFMTSALGQRAPHMAGVHTLDSVIARWQAIYERYGVAKPVAAQTPEAHPPGYDPLFDYS